MASKSNYLRLNHPYHRDKCESFTHFQVGATIIIFLIYMTIFGLSS